MLAPVWACWQGHVGHVFLGYKHPHWTDDPFRWPAAGNHAVAQDIERFDAQGYDVYFTPGVYDGASHTADRLLTDNVLWADLDKYESNSVMRERIKQLPPTYAWRSSENCCQAVWVMPTPPRGVLNVYGPGGINNALTNWLQADSSGFDAATFLRVPGTANNKDKPGRRGWRWDKRPYHARYEVGWQDVFDVLGAPETFAHRAPRGRVRGRGPVASVDVTALYARVPENVWRHVMRDDIDASVDRSSLQYKRVCMLLEKSDLSVDEIVTLAAYSPLYDDRGDAYTDVYRIAAKRGRC